MSSAQQIIDLAFAKSAASLPNTLTSPTELVARIGQCLREMFQLLGRENPNVIGTRAQVVFSSGGWQRPTDCLRAIKLVADSGTVAAPALVVGSEINVVAFDDQAFCQGLPSLTEFGQQFISTGQAIDPSGGTITLYYARAPIMPTQTSDQIDALFPTQFDDLLQSDLAAYMAKKDKRTEDEQTFNADKNALTQQLIEWSRGQTYSLAQRFPLVNPPTTNTDGGRQSSDAGG